MRSRSPSRLLVLAALAVGRIALGAAGATPITASYDGTLAVTGSSSTMAVAGALTDTNRVVNGTVAIALADTAAGLFYVHGTHRGSRVRLGGANASRTRFLWVGKVVGGNLVGKLTLHGTTGMMRGKLTLHRRVVTPPPTGGTPCDPVYFADPVMSTVLVPICAKCHVAGGAAQATTFRVTASDPTATQASTNLQVDVANPSASRLLQKPLALIPHGGGQQITAGSPEAQVLAHWADVVAGGNCGGGHAPTTGPELYAAECQGCHGADARGVDGRPSIRCNDRIHGVVVSGQGTGTNAMPPFPNLSDPQIALIQDYLTQLCTDSGRTGVDLYAADCALCHGTHGQGGRNSAGIRGPDVRCSSAGDMSEAVHSGTGWMPAFPQLSNADVAAVTAYVQGYCTGTIGGD